MRGRARAALAALLLVLLLLLPAKVRAEAALPDLLQQETERLLREMDLSDLEEAVPELDLKSVLEEAARGETALPLSALRQAAGQALAGGLSDLCPQMVRTLGLAVLSAALLRLRRLSGETGGARLWDLLCFLGAVLPAVQTVTSLLQRGAEASARMAELLRAVLPTMLALLSSLGASQSASQMQGLGLLLTGALTEGVRLFLFPLLGLAAALAAVSRLSQEARIGAAPRLMRSLVHMALGLGFTLFLGALTVQGATAESFDGVTLRAAKYAVDKFVPVIGGAFKDTTDTLVGCSLVVKNAVGAAGLAGLLWILLAPCAQVLLALFAFRLCAAALEPLGDARIVPALQDFADILSTLFILMISTGAMFFVFLAALMRLGLGFV